MLVNKVVFLIACLFTYGFPRTTAIAGFPGVVPAVHSFVASTGEPFSLPSTLNIVVDEDVASKTDQDGLSLIPSTLLSFGKTFANDAVSVFPGIKTRVSTGTARSDADVFMTITAEANFTLAKGMPTNEGYKMTISSTGVTINGAGARGLCTGFCLVRCILIYPHTRCILGHPNASTGVAAEQSNASERNGD